MIRSQSGRRGTAGPRTTIAPGTFRKPLTKEQRQNEKFIKFIGAKAQVALIGGTRYSRWEKTDYEAVCIAVNGCSSKFSTKAKSEEEFRAKSMLRDFAKSVLLTREMFEAYVDWLGKREEIYNKVVDVYAKVARKGAPKAQAEVLKALTAKGMDGELGKFIGLISQTEATEAIGFVGGVEYENHGEMELAFFSQWFDSPSRVVTQLESRVLEFHAANAQLVEKNTRLNEKLQRAKEKARSFSEAGVDASKKDVRITSLESQVMDRDRRITALQKQLDAANADKEKKKYSGDSQTSIRVSESLTPAAATAGNGGACVSPEARPSFAFKPTAEMPAMDDAAPAPGASGVPRSGDMGDTQELDIRDMEPVGDEESRGASPPPVPGAEDDLAFLRRVRRERRQATLEKYLYKPARFVKRHAVGLMVGAAFIAAGITGAIMYSQSGDSAQERAAKAFSSRTPITNPSGTQDEAPAGHDGLPASLGMGSRVKAKWETPKEKDKAAGGTGPKPKLKPPQPKPEESGPKLAEIGSNGMVASEVASSVYSKLGLNPEDHPQDIWTSLRKGVRDKEIKPDAPKNVGTPLMGRYIVLSTAFERFMSGQADPGERSRTQAINMGLELARICLNLANNSRKNALDGIERGDILGFAQEVLRYISSPNRVGKGMSAGQKKEAEELRRKIREQEVRSANVNVKEIIGTRATPGEPDAGEEF
jgi:hypothetical protein